MSKNLIKVYKNNQEYHITDENAHSSIDTIVDELNNLEVPDKISDLTDDVGILTDDDLSTEEYVYPSSVTYEDFFEWDDIYQIKSLNTLSGATFMVGNIYQGHLDSYNNLCTNQAIPLGENKSIRLSIPSNTNFNICISFYNSSTIATANQVGANAGYTVGNSVGVYSLTMDVPEGATHYALVDWDWAQWYVEDNNNQYGINWVFQLPHWNDASFKLELTTYKKDEIPQAKIIKAIDNALDNAYSGSTNINVSNKVISLVSRPTFSNGFDCNGEPSFNGGGEATDYASFVNKSFKASNVSIDALYTPYIVLPRTGTTWTSNSNEPFIIKNVNGTSYLKVDTDGEIYIYDSSTGALSTSSLKTLLNNGGGGTTETDPIWTSEKTNYYTKTEIDNKEFLTSSQIKTINNQSLIGEGNITIEGGEGISVVELTLAEYNALTDAQKQDTTKLYVISDATSIYYTKTQIDNKGYVNATEAYTQGYDAADDYAIKKGLISSSYCYSKTEIDNKIGDINTILENIIGE